MVQKVSAIYKAGTGHSSTVIPGDPGRVIVGSSGNVGYVTGTPSGVASGSFSTRLASELAPPAPPSRSSAGKVRRLIGVVLIVLAVVSIFTYQTQFEAYRRQLDGGVSCLATSGCRWVEPNEVEGLMASYTMNTYSATVVLFLAGGLFIVWSMRAAAKDRPRIEAEDAEYRRALSRWERLHYCAKCDFTFDAGLSGD